LQLQQAAEEIRQLPLDVMAVTFQSGKVVDEYVQRSGWPWPFLVDPDRELYTAYDMRRGSLWAILGPQSWWGYLKLILKGRSLQSPAGDVYQLGGDVLIDPTGSLRLHHVTRIPVDRPEIESILEIIRA